MGETLQCIDQQVFTFQAQVLKKSIEEHKWYLSEKAGHDVGLEIAQEHFFKTYLNGFAAGFRASYCGFVCLKRHTCRIAQRYLP